MKMCMWWIAVGVGLVASGLCEVAHAQRWSDAEVQGLLQQRIDKHVARGIAVALIEPDGSVRHLAAGESGNSRRPQVDSATVFEIGSISKVFTATLLGQKVEEGAFKLSTPLSEVLNDSADWHEPGVGAVSLQQLATHTSGLPRLPLEGKFFASMLLSFRNPYAAYSEVDMWRYVRQLKHEVKAAEPVAYSNLGVGLLGQTLAATEKKSYADLVQSRILKPLGMTASGITTPPEWQAYLAQGHNASLLPVPHWDLPAMPGAGALRSNTHDLARFVQAHLRGTLAGATATQAQQASMGETRAIALGWFIQRQHGDEIFWHNGGTGGFRTFAGFSKKTGLGVVVLSNVSVGVDDLGLHLLNRQFQVSSDPRKFSLASAVVTLGFGLGLLLRPLTAVAAGGMPPALPATGWRRIWQRWRQESILLSKEELCWTLLDLLALAFFAYLFVAWEWTGTLGRQLFFALVGALVLRMAWRSRNLPRYAAPRPGNSGLRILARGITLLMLLLAIWSLW